MSMCTVWISLISEVHIACTCRLRAPKAPDANADMGQHSFSYAVMPHSGKQTLYNISSRIAKCIPVRYNNN